MTLSLTQVDHVQLTCPPALEEATARFYEDVLGLRRIPKPTGKAGPRGGAWFQLGAVQVHLSVDAVGREANLSSKRHICYRVDDLMAAEGALRASGVEIIPDDNPTPGWTRFYVRDPAGNRIEIARPV